MHPEEFDVLVMPLMYGDIVSDIGAGPDRRARHGAGREPRRRLRGVRGRCTARRRGTRARTASTRAALLLSGVMLLRHVGEDEAADRVERALGAVIREGRDVTYDLKPDRNDPTAVGTREFADAVIAAMALSAATAGRSDSGLRLPTFLHAAYHQRSLP